MPTSYAHFKFGQMVAEELPSEYKVFPLVYPDYYNPALHGPDSAFYLLWNADLVNLGNDLHYWSGKDYFEKVGKEILAEMEHPKKGAPMGTMTSVEAEKKLAYLFGFMCHYALDRTCHEYINQKTEGSLSEHYKIEAEFDRFLMQRDGLDPLRHKVTGHIHPNPELAEVAAVFFPGAKPMELLQTFVMQKLILNFFVSPSKLRRKLYQKFTNVTGFEDLASLMMPVQPDRKYDESNEVLLELFEKSIPDAVEFITTFFDTMGGKIPWNEKYNWNFNGELC